MYITGCRVVLQLVLQLNFGFAISDSHLSGKGSKEFWLLGREFGSRLVSLSQGIGGDFACLCADEVNVAFENCNE